MSDIDRFLPGVERRGLRRLRLRREGRSERAAMRRKWRLPATLEVAAPFE
jgi:hypothetical protein